MDIALYAHVYQRMAAPKRKRLHELKAFLNRQQRAAHGGIFTRTSRSVALLLRSGWHFKAFERSPVLLALRTIGCPSLESVASVQCTVLVFHSEEVPNDGNDGNGYDREYLKVAV